MTRAVWHPSPVVDPPAPPRAARRCVWSPSRGLVRVVISRLLFLWHGRLLHRALIPRLSCVCICTVAVLMVSPRCVSQRSPVSPASDRNPGRLPVRSHHLREHDPRVRETGLVHGRARLLPGAGGLVLYKEIGQVLGQEAGGPLDLPQRGHKGMRGK